MAEPGLGAGQVALTAVLPSLPRIPDSSAPTVIVLHRTESKAPLKSEHLSSLSASQARFAV